jgi:hypothetical protein
VAKHYDEIQKLGTEVLVVTLSKPEMLRLYLSDKNWTFPVVADPNRDAYRAFGLSRTSYATFFRPGVILRYIGLIFRGQRPHAVNEGEDVLQLGGDFVLDAGQRIVYQYASKEPTDRPQVSLLLDAIKKARGPAS